MAARPGNFIALLAALSSDLFTALPDMALTYGFLPLMTVAAAAILIYVTVGWLISLRLRDSGIMDVLWGPGFILASAVTAAAAALTATATASMGFPDRWMLALSLVSVWGIRLAVHIGQRNVGKPEDYRYAAWRAEAGEKWWWRSYLKVFLLQGVVMLIALTPVVFVLSHSDSAGRSAQAGLGWLALVGTAVWLVGFLFEAIGDEQLRRFKSDPENEGRVMRRGLWRYTRHPNYFGESLIWFGLWIIACEIPFGWATVVSPLLMLFLLLRVSGVAMLERGLTASKPKYREYVEQTSAFFPWRPRS